MWKHRINTFLFKSENNLSAVRRICQCKSSFFSNAFKDQSYFIPSVIFSRGVKGSNRDKKERAIKKKMRLANELETIYGIPQKKEFNLKHWFKMNYFAEFKAFQARLDIRFNDYKILFSAFAHPSFTNELESIQRNDVSLDDKDMRRRFELRDEISDIPFQNLSLMGYETTQLAIKEEIYKKYPSITTSICFDISKYLTSRETVSTVAKNIAIDDLILLSRELDEIEDWNEEYHIQFTEEDILCDTFYSVVGAIVMDHGVDTAKHFIKDLVVVMMDYEDLSDHVTLDNAQRELRNILFLNGVQGPTTARTISEAGVSTDFPFFHVGQYCFGCQVGEGSGYSLATARADALKNAVFRCLEGDVDFSTLREHAKRIHARKV